MVGSDSFESDKNQLSAISASIANLHDSQSNLQSALKRSQLLMWVILALVVSLSCAMFHIWQTEIKPAQICHAKYDAEYNKVDEL